MHAYVINNKGTVLMMFPVIFQTVINFRMLSTGGQGDVTCTASHWAVLPVRSDVRRMNT